MKTDYLSIRYSFSEHEIADLAREQSRALADKSNKESDLKAVKKDYESQIAMLDAKVSSISTRVSSGFEMRNVRCILMDHRIAGFRLVVRTDNGHVTRRRKLDPEDMQMKLTEEAPAPYYAQAGLIVDDEGWDAEGCVIPVFEDEWEVLRTLRDVKMEPIIGKDKRIEEGKKKK